ncbi:FUSC family protein [Cohnella silvisoli]|uniref:Aromatic acid exporter family protein n=1 Tax=Cohnella silvisoli TaxID=2873699 RepID=A0ABV1KM32_9BACL|nr:aromatic acid exporter family protein [Cohnella silvisoli]MCD9020523.1 FUSC family protein [Cohnella silvisoli]
MTIGARVLKTGLAVAVALWLGQLVGLESPLIAAISAIFTIQPSIYRSWMQVLEQVQSNVLGAIIAIGAVFLIGNTPISVGLVCIGVILLCIRLKTEDTIALTLVTVVVIMEAQGQGWMLAWDRLAAILTGMVSAFAVNVIIAPPRHRNRFLKHIEEAQAQLSRLLRTAVSNELKESVYRVEQNHLKSKLRKLDEFYDLFAEERVWRKNSRLKRARLLIVYKGMLTSLERGLSLIDAVEDHYWGVSTTQAWNRLIDRQIEALCGYHEQLLWKWEGKMKPGASAAAPPPEASILLSELIGERSDEDMIARARLLVITSAVYTYEESLRRLDKLMEQWLQREEGTEQAEEAE